MHACRPLHKQRRRIHTHSRASLSSLTSSSSTLHPSCPAVLVSRYSDWICDSCQSISFARRTKCFQCGAEKPKNPRIALRSSKGDDIIEKRVLLVKGLSSNTDEGLLLDSFQVFGQVLLTAAAAAQSLHPSTPLALNTPSPCACAALTSSPPSPFPPFPSPSTLSGQGDPFSPQSGHEDLERLRVHRVPQPRGGQAGSRREHGGAKGPED